MNSRRRFLQQSSSALGCLALSRALRAESATADFIASTEVQVVLHGAGKGAQGWFQTRACLVPASSGKGNIVLMTLQTIMGSDFYGPVHFMTSEDLGKTWTAPQPIPDLGWHDKGNGLSEGVCDAVPQWHAPTKTLLVMGLNVYYKDNKVTQKTDQHWPVYKIRDAEGNWGERTKLVWDDPRGASTLSCGGGERLWFENGDLLLPVSYGEKNYKHRNVTTLRCAYDGKTLTVKEVGTELPNASGRGMIEPSVTKFRGKYYITIRAEDGRAYTSTSDDGMKWAEKRAWAWDDGTPLETSTTQQHWLLHSEGLHLAYTRKTEQNAKVMRYRAPLFVAAVDHEKLCLRRDTERTLFPLKGDPLNAPGKVTLTDNFHPIAVSPDESWITVGENTNLSGTIGDLLIGRIRWSKPNGLV